MRRRYRCLKKRKRVRENIKIDVYMASAACIFYPARMEANTFGHGYVYSFWICAFFFLFLIVYPLLKMEIPWRLRKEELHNNENNFKERDDLQREWVPRRLG